MSKLTKAEIEAIPSLQLCLKCQADYGHARYDRYGIYSGRACDACADGLPGQGDMWDYEPEHGEAIENPDATYNSSEESYADGGSY